MTGAPILTEALSHSRSRGVDRLVLLVLAFDADPSSREASMHLERIARRAAVHRNRARFALRALVEAGDIAELQESPSGHVRCRVVDMAGVR